MLDGRGAAELTGAVMGFERDEVARTESPPEATTEHAVGELASSLAELVARSSELRRLVDAHVKELRQR